MIRNTNYAVYAPVDWVACERFWAEWTRWCGTDPYGERIWAQCLRNGTDDATFNGAQS